MDQFEVIGYHKLVVRKSSRAFQMLVEQVKFFKPKQTQAPKKAGGPEKVFKSKKDRRPGKARSSRRVLKT